jgi:hypothetical protein
MKIIIEQHEETNTFEAKNDDLTACEFVEVLYRMLHAVGYHRKSINEAFMDLADELEVEEDRIARENHEAIEQEDYEMRKAMEKEGCEAFEFWNKETEKQ